MLIGADKYVHRFHEEQKFFNSHIINTPVFCDLVYSKPPEVVST